MKSSFRWYGDSDPVTLDKIRQIPGMRSIVSAVYDVKPGEVWPEEASNIWLMNVRQMVWYLMW